MKKLFIVFLFIVIMLSMMACSSNEITKFASLDGKIKHLPYTISENTKLNKVNLVDKGKIREEEYTREKKYKEELKGIKYTLTLPTRKY